MVSVRPGAVESFLGLVDFERRPVGGADPIGGNVLYGDPMYSSDVFSGGPSNIARNCFLGIGGRASFTWGSKKRKLNKFYRHANTKHDNTGIASGAKFPYSTWKGDSLDRARA